MLPVLTRTRPRRIEYSGPLDPYTLPGLNWFAPAAGNGTGGTWALSGGAAGTLHDTPTWNPGVKPSVLSLAGSLSLAANSAQGVTLPTLTLPSLTNTGAGFNGTGPAFTLTAWINYSGAAGGANRDIWVGAASVGLRLKDRGGGNYVLNWLHSTDHNPTTGSVPAGQWVLVYVRVEANATYSLGYGTIGGSITQVHTFAGSAFPPALTNLGSLAGGTTGLNGSICDARPWDTALSDAELNRLLAGLELPFEPARRYRLDEGTGTAAADSARVRVAGSLVATLTDLSGAGMHLTAAGAARPLFEDEATAPLAGKDGTGNPIGGDFSEGIRFDGVGNCLSRSGVFGSAQAAFTASLAGRLWKPYFAAGASNVRQIFWGASNNGTYGTAAGDSWAYLGYRYGQYNFATTEFAWEYGCKAVGGTAIVARAGFADVFPRTLALRYVGGASLGLYLDGELLHQTTAGVPASLNLSGAFELGAGGGGTVNPSGWQHFHGAAGTAAWSAGQIAALHRYYEELATFNAPTWGVVYDGGTFNGANPTGFNLGASLFRHSNGNYFCAWTRGATDPSDTLHGVIAKSTDGLNWEAPLVVHDTAIATYLLFGDIIELPSGEFWAYTSTSPAATGDAWTSYRVRLNGDGTIHTPAALFTVPGTSHITYYSPLGVPVLVPGGGLRLSMCGPRTATTFYDPFWAASADDGDSWTLYKDHYDTGGGGFANYGETAMLLLGGTGSARRWLMICRGGRPCGISRSEDDGLTWPQRMAVGARNSLLITSAFPWLMKGTSDPAGRIFWFDTIRGADAGTAQFSSNCRPGVTVQSSSDEGRRWGPPVPLIHDINGFGYPSAIDLGDGRFLFAATDGTVGKIRCGIIPFSLIP